MYNHFPKFCDLGRMQQVKGTVSAENLTWGFPVTQGRGSWWLSDMWTEWVSHCYARESWASSEPFFPVRFEIHCSLEKLMLHFRPVAVLLVSLWIQRWVTVSTRVHFTYDHNAGLSYFAVLSYDRSSMLNDNCISLLNRGSLLDWTNGPDVQACMARRTEELTENSKRKWLCHSASFSKGKRIHVNHWKLLHIVLVQEYT